MCKEQTLITVVPFDVFSDVTVHTNTSLTTMAILVYFFLMPLFIF